MTPRTRRIAVAGPAGAIECAIDEPAPGAAAPRGVALVCHPHPQHGGTMDNKVVQTLARAFLQLGYRTVRFNYRGVGASQGAWDEGRGEIDDAMAVIAATREDAGGAASASSSPSSTTALGPASTPAAAPAAQPTPLVVAGFSFGGYVASHAAQRLPESAKAERLVLVGPSTQRQQVAQVPADTLVIHGEADDVVPLIATFDWARPQSLPVTVVPGGGHFFHGQLPLLKSIVLAAWH